jgi:type III restriction enzyme
VNADSQVADTWHYLLVSEADVNAAKGPWVALKQLGI